MNDCLFCKIISGEIPSQKVYEDEKVFAFLDINPIQHGHTLVVPKTHSLTFNEMNNDDIVAVFSAVKKITPSLLSIVSAKGFNIGMNNGEVAGQIIHHSHVHIIPRFEGDGLKHWPALKGYNKSDFDSIAKNLRENL